MLEHAVHDTSYIAFPRMVLLVVYRYRALVDVLVYGGEYQLIPSQTIESGIIQLPEHLATDTVYLHPLVVYHVTAALPVKQLHQRAAAVEEHIY